MKYEEKINQDEEHVANIRFGKCNRTTKALEVCTISQSRGAIAKRFEKAVRESSREEAADAFSEITNVCDLQDLSQLSA